MSQRSGSVFIESVQPQVDCGHHPIKRVLGESLEVRADIFKEGHDALCAILLWRPLSPAAKVEWQEIPMKELGNDRWCARVTFPTLGRFAYTLEAWPDAFASWAHELSRKVEAHQRVESELLEGAALLKDAAGRARAASAEDAERLLEAEKALSRGGLKAIAAALDASLRALAARYPDRRVAVRYEPELEVIVERPRARAGAWYEFFPRSASQNVSRHGTFADCEKLLPEISRMGFDVIYLPPVHPIGSTGRKGKNNSLHGGPEDLGSPWAIGNKEGGHKAIHPQLGTLEDFRRLVSRAGELGIEVALDLAYQCSPDHPYLKEHPEWFSHRPDGTIKTAENPPKRYEDIVNFDFMGAGRETLWSELKSVVLFWINAGVRIFRVDNPHTKPLVFWRWLIEEIHREHPDIVFLAEAFTRPKIMKALAKVGFSQSYTYFTWRHFKPELEEYFTELTQSSVAEYMRGNLWPNTPDILPEVLQQGGPPAFKLRLALAVTLSSSYGIYQGYELCEARALPGKEEYQDSEKYQQVKWDFDRPGNIRTYVAALNRIRRENPALLLYRNLRFRRADNERVLFYSKATEDKSNQLLIAVSLDPYAPQEAVLHVPLQSLGIADDEVYQVHELTQDTRALWKGPSALVQLTPEHPAAIWRVLRFVKSEKAFDYYE